MTFEATNCVLDDYKAQWRGSPAFVAAVARAKDGVKAIRIQQSQQFLNGTKDPPPWAAVNGNGATLSLPETISHTRRIYRNEIDKMMEKFRVSAPDFYKAYVSARIIVDRTRTRRSKKNVTPAERRERVTLVNC